MLSGCVHTVTHQSLLNVEQQNLRQTLQTAILYTGSDDAYDYFRIEPQVGCGSKWRVQRSDDFNAQRVPRTKDKSTWKFYFPAGMTD